ncbi:MAG: hypothetical protein QM699_07820 [Amaricoccus sp.]|uniref:hypothetical protein n=1 Tax=Amaricoccus sp. TaxID=1872485 RepID=UPI0039E339B5
MDRVTRAGPILALIRNHEAPARAAATQGVPSQHDVVWSGLRTADRPPRRLSTMTVGEVQSWQQRVVSGGAASSACGGYQFIRKTLASLDLPPARVFDAACQDEAALQLLDRRGWAKCEAGTMTPEAFGDQLAREWASFPVLRDQQGQHRPVRRGQSFYAGDGLNAAYVEPDDVLAAIREALRTPTAIPSPAREMSLWAGLAHLFAMLFGSKKA